MYREYCGIFEKEKYSNAELKKKILQMRGGRVSHEYNIEVNNCQCCQEIRNFVPISAKEIITE